MATFGQFASPNRKTATGFDRVPYGQMAFTLPRRSFALLRRDCRLPQFCCRRSLLALWPRRTPPSTEFQDDSDFQSARSKSRRRSPWRQKRGHRGHRPSYSQRYPYCQRQKQSPRNGRRADTLQSLIAGGSFGGSSSRNSMHRLSAWCIDEFPIIHCIYNRDAESRMRPVDVI